METAIAPLTFEPERFLKIARDDHNLREEIVKEINTPFRELEAKARKKTLNTNQYQMLKVLFNVYMNYSNYEKKYLEV